VTAQERAQAKATRFMLLGAMSEMDEATQAEFNAACVEARRIAETDAGKLALAVVTCEIAENKHD
jgi:hypothetical protein